MLKDKVYLEMNIPNKFLASDKYVDFTAENIISKSVELFDGIFDDTQKARIAYEYVRTKSRTPST